MGQNSTAPSQLFPTMEDQVQPSGAEPGRFPRCSSRENQAPARDPKGSPEPCLHGTEPQRKDIYFHDFFFRSKMKK